MKRPIMLVFAGPNGSGKSTITARVLPIGSYVNADVIQRHLQCTPWEAAQIAEATRKKLLSESSDFTFETVLSTERNYLLMEQAKQANYRVICIFVLTKDPQINIERVKQRVANGGHDVPSEKVVSRYCRALKLFPKLFSVCDELYVYDNSADRNSGTPHMILKSIDGKGECVPSNVWTAEMLKELIEGRYAERFE